MNKTVICVTGFGWSGSGAVFDLLREYDDVDIVDDSGSDFEFGLLGAKDGLYDLRYYLTHRYSRIGSSSALDCFEDTVMKQSKLLGYERVFDGKYASISKEYINSLLDFSFEGWTFSDVTNPSKENRRKNIYNSFIDHIFGNRITVHIPLSVKIRNKLMLKVSHKIRVSYNPKDFMQKTKIYLDKLFDIVHKNKDNPLVFDQIFPPDNPCIYFDFFDDSKCVVVKRDPRDTYLLAKCAYSYMSIPLPIDNVEDFILFYQKVVEGTKEIKDSRVLILQFEDLVYRYDEMVSQIESFLGISHHTRPLSKFDPSISVNNTRLYERYPQYSKEIARISEALPESLYDFSKYQFNKSSNEVF